jgi:hypothetical protein
MGPPCNGSDCDDDDPRAHPGAPFRYDPPTETTLGDWNCNNAIELETVGFFITCSALPSMGVCTKAHGFAGSPDCGELDTFVTCGWVDGACAVTTSTMRREGCR